MPLNVYKASAGSGKTYRLAADYIKLLIQKPDSYRNILAVTFTNKATGEMKERIMNTLYALSLGQSDMVNLLSEELKLNPDIIEKRASLSLKLIIHDYGHFNILTIDRFFQSLLKYMAKELGLESRFNIELDNKRVLSEAIKRMIADCDKNPELRKWITSYIYESINDGKTWNIEKGLNDFGQNIFQEFFKENEKKFEKILDKDKNFIKSFKSEITILRKQYEAKLLALPHDFFTLLDNNGLTQDDCSYKRNGAAGYFINLQNGIFSGDLFQKKRLQDALVDPSKWGKKIPENIAYELTDITYRTEEKRAKLAMDYYSLVLIEKNINQIGLMMDISHKVRILNEEQNQFLLSDTGPLLSEMLEDEDASFIFEKAGSEFQYILFDEFQDTSTMQWKTFRPLIKESLSNGFTSLIVGDEKQAIYRWRNGSWKILGNIDKEVSPFKVDIHNLTFNWRSEDTIVNFNNAVFDTIIDYYDSNLVSQELSKDSSVEEKSITDMRIAYSSITQTPKKVRDRGYVECNFITKVKKTSMDESELTGQDLLNKELLKKVIFLQKKGINPNDITILIRYNKDIAPLAEYFAANKKEDGFCYDIISDDAFLLCSSLAIQTIINALRFILDRTNNAVLSTLCSAYQIDIMENLNFYTDIADLPIEKEGNKEDKDYKKILNTKLLSYLPQDFIPEEFIKMPIVEIVEKIYQVFNLKKLQGQDGFMYSFMDGVKDYLDNNTSDINDFLNHYEETLSSKSIPAGSRINGIRILSIHKSKGLEFDTVIIPACDWNIATPRTGSLIWCTPPNREPYNKMPILPIGMGKLIPESLFFNDYNNEINQMTIDNINLLYVAFTRASKNLITFSQVPSEVKKISTVGDLLQDITPKLLEKNHGLKTQDEENENIYKITFGKLENLSEEKSCEKPSKKATELIQKGSDIPISFNSFTEKTIFKQSNKSIEFSGRSNSTPYIERGKLMHFLFSKIKTDKNIEKRVKELLNQGLITQDEELDLIKKVKEDISKSNVQDWYSGKYKLYNECAIICKDKYGKITTRRPDRVMLDEDNTIIVDFKFGQPARKYHKQILEYKKLMSSMNYKNIKCYLWYVDNKQIEEVK